MNKNIIKNSLFLVIVNSIFVLVSLYLLYIAFTQEGNIGYFISWVEGSTKKFALFFMILLFLFFLTGKKQYKFYLTLKNSYSWIPTILKYLYIFLLSIIASIFVNYYFQYFQNLKDPLQTIDWITNNSKIFLAGVLYLSLLFVLVFSIIGNISISTIVTSIVLLLLGYIHYHKMDIRVEPLYPGDYKQITQLKDVISMVSNYVTFTEIFLVTFIIFMLFIGVYFLPKLKISIWIRGIIFIITLFFLYSFTYFPGTFMKSFVEKHDINVIKWNQLENYRINGFLFGFITNLQESSFEEPKGYSKKNVIETVKKYVESNDYPVKSNQTPNIIYLMSESFWDPLRLELEFSQDPIANFRKLANEHSSGYVLSPAFAGGTANVEFEALTGFSTLFIKEGVIPYQDFVSKKPFVPTIVSDLEKKGYDTLAIHPYNKIFYKREHVYNTFGFNEFLHMETVTHKEPSLSGYISDESLSLEILDHIKNTDKPIFIHAVSMQNHIPYNQAEKENKIKVFSDLTEESTKVLEGYTEGIRRTDQSLKLLVDQLEQIDEPTILVFWGDHLPYLDEVYNEVIYDDEDANMNTRKYFETPLLIYSNFEVEKQDLNTISTFYLSPIVYGMTGLEKPAFYHLLDQLQNEISAIKGNVRIGSDQQFIENLTNEQEELLADYQLLQYDLLMGKQYSKEILFE